MENGSTSDRAWATGDGPTGSSRSPVDDDTGSTDELFGVTGSARAQTTIDFTVGVVLFVFVLITIFTFVSGTIQPFTTGDQEDIVAVNRVADGLSKDTLGDPDTPYMLDTDCTRAFFNRTDSQPTDCRFGGSPLESQVGVPGNTFLNVTIRGNVSGSGSPDELLCWDASAEELVEQGDADCSGAGVEPLAVGDDTTGSSQSSVTARRAVSIDGTSVSLVVKLW